MKKFLCNFSAAPQRPAPAGRLVLQHPWAHPGSYHPENPARNHCESWLGQQHSPEAGCMHHPQWSRVQVPGHGAWSPGGRGRCGAHSCRWLRSPCCSRRRGPGCGRRRGGSRRALPGAGRTPCSSRSRPGPGGTRGGSGAAPRGSSMAGGTAGRTPAGTKPSLAAWLTAAISLGRPGNPL